MKYEALKRKIIKDPTDAVPGIAIETLELIPKNYAVSVTVSPSQEVDLESMKLTIATEIATDLLTNLDTETSPKGLKSYKLSSVVYYKPNEKELYDLLRTQYRLNDSLNVELYDYRQLMKSPWKLFKQFFKSLFN